MAMVIGAANYPAKGLRQPGADDPVVIGAAAAGQPPGAVENIGARPGHRLHDHQPQALTGHVDATGEVLIFEERGKNIYLQVRVPEEFSHYLADKGSIAVDGCSLTVCDVQQDLFAVWLIPHTLSLTSLESLKAGDLVNLEFDLLAKYVERISSRGQ